MKIETKFNIGDEVWFIHGCKAKSGQVEVVRPNTYLVVFQGTLRYKHADHILHENVFKTKEELIESLFN